MNACVCQHDLHEGGSVIVWGGIHLHGRTPLHLVQGNLTGVRYRDEIVRRIVLPTLQAMGPGARVVTGFLQQHHATQMNWPAHSQIWHPSKSSGTSSAAVFMTIIPSTKPSSAVPVPSAGVECHPSTDAGDTSPVHEKKMCRMPHGKWQFYALLTVLKCTEFVNVSFEGVSL